MDYLPFRPSEIRYETPSQTASIALFARVI